MAQAPRTTNQKREDDLIDQKERVTQDVRMRFAKYGEEPLSVILAYALQSSRMPILMDRLNIRAKGNDLTSQLDAIGAYLAQEGAARFTMLALQKHFKKKEVEAIQLDDLEFDPPPPALEELGEAIAEVLAPPPAPAAEAAPAAETAPPAPTTRPDAPMIKVPGYSGPDRRWGEERRGKPDRRLALAAISRNKRFGGDRRKIPKGRRKEDQRLPEYWWRMLGTPTERILREAMKKK